MRAYGEFVCVKVVSTEQKSASGFYVSGKNAISYEVVNGTGLTPGEKVLLMNNDEYKHPYTLDGVEVLFIDKNCILGVE